MYDILCVLIYGNHTSCMGVRLQVSGLPGARYTGQVFLFVFINYAQVYELSVNTLSR